LRRRQPEQRVNLPRTLTTFEPQAWWGRDDIERRYDWAAARHAWAEKHGLDEFPGDAELDLPDGNFYPEDI
jgi:hypothetical protein